MDPYVLPEYWAKLPSETKTCELIRAAADGRIGMVAAMLQEEGEDKHEYVRASDYDRRTALHLAAHRGQLEMCDFLLSNGAQINAEDYLGRTPIQEAALGGHDRVAESLKRHGASTPQIEAREIDMIQWASQGNVAEMERLRDACDHQGCEPLVNCADWDGRTPLHAAAQSGHSEACRWLIDNGALPQKNAAGRTPVDVAHFGSVLGKDYVDLRSSSLTETQLLLHVLRDFRLQSEQKPPASPEHKPSDGHDQLQDLIGNYCAFIDTIYEYLLSIGIDAAPYEMDHICYRCETVAQYQGMIRELAPRFGTVAIEGMIGGRPISTITLHEPITHGHFQVQCLEIPCPKPGKHYDAGLEHAELVVGVPADGVFGSKRLESFMEDCQQKGLDIDFDLRALKKEMNADVSVVFTAADGKEMSVKFHQRPLYEVVAYELEHGHCIPVPEGYFESVQ